MPELNDDKVQQLWALAEKIAPAKFIPERLRGDVPSIFYQLATGHEMGLQSMHSARSIYVGAENGVGMKGDVILSLLLSHGFTVKFAPQTDPVIGCTCTITRPGAGEGTAESRSFTLEDAARIRTNWDSERKCWNRLVDHPYYTNYPAEMCQWRALAKCARIQAPDIIGGIYLPEELQESTGSMGLAPEATGEHAEPEEEFAVGEKEPPSPTEQSSKPTPEASSKVDAPIAETKQAAPDTKATEVKSDAGKKAADKFWAQKESAQIQDPAPQSPVTSIDFEALVADMSRRIGGEPKAARIAIGNCFQGFLGVRTVPKDQSKLKPILEKIIAATASPDSVAAFKANPTQFGATLAGRSPSLLQQEFDMLRWPANVQELARKAMAKSGQDEEHFLAWIHLPIAGDTGKSDGISIASMAPEALEILLPMYLLVKGRAFEPIDYAVATSHDIAGTLLDMVKLSGKPISNWDAPFAEHILGVFKEATKPQAKQAPQEQEDPFSGGLPFTE